VTLDVTPPGYVDGMYLIEHTFGDGAIGDLDVDALFDRLVLSLQLLGDREFICRAQHYEETLERQRLVVAARVAGSSGDTSSDRKRARRLVGGRSRSRRSVNRDARRAAAVAANPDLGDKVADGSVAADSLDALAKAADPDTGAIPSTLIEEVDGLSPGQTDHAVDRFLEETADRDQVNERYQLQQRARRCRRGTKLAGAGRPELATLTLEGPDAVVDRLWNQITVAADAAYKCAGGRDKPRSQHAPWEHRLFDAAVELIDGEGGGLRPAAGSKPTVVVSIGLDDPELKPAIQHGTGPISDDVFNEYVARSPVFALFTDANGRPLWLGRTRRHATVAQFLTLAVRDRGCVLCGASVSRCEAHHLIPWNASAKGRTDIDNLALLCGPCHRDLHRRKHTLYRRGGSARRVVWHTRPATPQETTSPPPETIQRE